MRIYFDGGCKPNPGQMEVCVVVSPARGHPRTEVMKLGYGTNNVAEWSALIWAVRIAAQEGIHDPIFLGDSQLVINQASGKWKVNGETLAAFRNEFNKLTKGVNFTLGHVPRARNLAGVFLEHGKL